MVVDVNGELDPTFAQALALAHNQPATPANIERVGKATDAESARWAFTQWSLRERARSKFHRAEDMLFDREALEQATHEAVSAYRARQFPGSVTVLDGTCSLGGDLIAFAKQGRAVGVDLDPTRLGLAAWNLRIHEVSANLVESSCFDIEAPDCFAFFDPARRANGKRVVDIADFAPNPSQIVEHFRGLALGMMKLTPMLRDEILAGLGPSCEFWSYGRECREAVVTWGESAGEGIWAVHVESGERLAAGEAPWPTETPGPYFYDVDPACVRAHATGTLAAAYDLDQFGDATGYLTGGMAVSSPWIRRYAVVDCLPGHVDKTTQHLRAHNLRANTIKTRTPQIDLENLKRNWKRTGSEEIVIAIVSLGKRHLHVLLKEEAHSP